MEINKEFATLQLPDRDPVQIPVITDNMGTGYITYDPGFVNTGSCTSSICYVNGEQGILRYRGYDIEDLVENCDFVEVAYLLIKGELPNAEQRKHYTELLNKESLLHFDMQNFFRGYPFDAHPMSVLAAMSVSLSAFYPEMDDIDPELQVDFAVTRLVSKIRTITAFTYRHKKGEEFFEKILRALFQHKNKIVKRALINSSHELGIDRKDLEDILNSIDDKFNLNERVFKLSPEKIGELSNLLFNNIAKKDKDKL